MTRFFDRKRALARFLTALIAVFGVAVGLAGPAHAQTCNTHQCTIDLTPTIYLNNNMWGNPNGQYGTGSVTKNSATSWSTSWNFTGAPNYSVITYPAATLGWFYGYRDTGTGLPFQIATNTPVNVTANWTVTGTFQGDVAFDLWADRTQNPAGNPDHEIMIWTKVSGVGPSLSIIGTPTIDGVTWDVYHGVSDWDLTAFLVHGGGNQYDLGSINFNVMDFVNYLVSVGVIDASEYLISVPFGVELDDTPAFPTINGTLNVTNYTAVVGTPPPPVIPNPPTNVGATGNNTSANVWWTSSMGATSYNVKRSTVSGSGYTTVATGIPTNSYTNTGLTNGTTYYYVVTATNSAGTSGNSSQASATPAANTIQYDFETDTMGWTISGLPLVSVTRSTTQHFTGVASLALNLNFNQSGLGDAFVNNPPTSLTNGKVVTYHVWIPAGATQLTAIQPYVQDANFSWTGAWTPIANLTQGAWNTIQVTVPSNAVLPMARVGVEVQTNAAWTTSLYVDSISWTGTGGGIPPVPAGLTATAGNTQVALSWNASTGATAYDVKRSTVSGSGYATISSPTGTSYTNTALSNGTTYYYVVAAKNASGSSANSTQVSATPSAGSRPAAPTGVSAVAGIGQALISWSASTGATSYNVKRSTVNGSGYATVGSPTITSFMNTGLTNGTTYYYVVTAVSSGGESGNSSQVSAAPSATVPQAQIASGTATIDGTVEAAWNNATAYLLSKQTGTISGYTDCSATWKAMWDTTNLYILVDVMDNTKNNDSTNVFDDDAPEVYLDADNNGGTSYDANDRQILFGWGDASPSGGMGRSVTGVTFSKADPTSTSYRMEIKIPWALEVFTPSANAIVGIDVHVNDDDDGAARDGKLEWNDGTDQAWTNPNLFGDGKLNAAGGVPPVPTGLTATAGNAQVALTWNASSGATAYDVKRSTVSGSGYATISSPTGTSYTNTGLTNGTTYFYVVAAKNASGSSANSSQVSATPTAGGGDTAQYNFEAGVQGWVVAGAPATAVASSTTQHFAGTHSLAVTINGAAGCGDVNVPSPGVTAGKVITYHVWVPAGMPISQVQPYVTDNAGAWDGTGVVVTAGQWNTMTLTVPANAVMPVTKLGIQFCTTATWSGTVYVDTVSWP